MAAPPEITIADLSGSWVMNKSLSDSTDAILALQGIGWLTRKAIGFATVTLHVTQYPIPASSSATSHIDISQTATGGIKGTTELRELDWEERSHTDHIFGNLKGRSRWLDAGHIAASAGETGDYVSREEENKFLNAEWLEDEEEAGGPGCEKHVESFVINEEKKWTARQIWGFSIIDGQRYYVRRIVVRKVDSDDCLMARLVYSWQGPADGKKSASKEEEDDGLVY